ncbi:MAG: sigma 54-interacting transcriptional regulator [Desulfotignum sp.]
MGLSDRNDVKRFCLPGVDFSRLAFMELLCDLDLGVLMTDDKGILIFYNDVQATIDKMDPADVLGKPITQVYKYNNDSSTCMRVLKHGKPIINYSLSYRSHNADVGNTIHNFYCGKQGHYVDINCAAIPENLIEGLLFGTVKGAYTGAVDRAGLFEQANGGTIFLDEINSMPLHLQGKLLRVLQERKLRRVGSLTTIDLNVKIISSLNQSPRELVRSGGFRMDLFYRLGVIYIKLPALRDRRPDIEELSRHFLQKYNAQLGKSLRNIAPEVIDFFWQYPWPGNVRELEHVIESAVNFAGRDESCLKLEHCYFANILEQEPPRWNRTLWGLILGLLALGLLSTGALKAVQLSSIVVALPLIPVLLLMVFSLMKWLREDYGEILKTNIQALPPEKIKPAVYAD